MIFSIMLQIKWQLTNTCISSYTSTFCKWEIKKSQHWFLFCIIVNNHSSMIVNTLTVWKIIVIWQTFWTLLSSHTSNAIAISSSLITWTSSRTSTSSFLKFVNQNCIALYKHTHVINEIHLLSLGCYSCNLKPKKL